MADSNYDDIVFDAISLLYPERGSGREFTMHTPPEDILKKFDTDLLRRIGRDRSNKCKTTLEFFFTKKTVHAIIAHAKKYIKYLLFFFCINT